MEILLDSAADALRARYIRTFINVHHPCYAEHIAALHHYADGWCYRGYLWDFFAHADVCTPEEALATIAASRTPLYVMWDIHSAENIFIEDYWKYPKRAVLSLSAAEFPAVFPSLPEDIYVFPPQFDWTVALTHEFWADNTRDCRIVRKHA